MRPAESVCGAGRGSGVVLRASEYLGFEDSLWCQDCEAGRAKAVRAAQLMSAALLKRTIRVA
jgi:hypothetical protein